MPRIVKPTYSGTKADGTWVFFLSVMAQMQRSSNIVPKIYFRKINRKQERPLYPSIQCHLFQLKLPGHRDHRLQRAMELDKLQKYRPVLGHLPYRSSPNSRCLCCCKPGWHLIIRVIKMAYFTFRFVCYKNIFCSSVMHAPL